MKFLGIIPARYASTRFPAKPLAILGGKTVIQRVYEQVAGVLDDVYVATDDERIEAAVKAFGGKVVMTSVDHKVVRTVVTKLVLRSEVILMLLSIYKVMSLLSSLHNLML